MFGKKEYKICWMKRVGEGYEPIWRVILRLFNIQVPDDVSLDDPLPWWKEKSASFPLLAQLARLILPDPASSAPSERSFSKLGRISAEERFNTKPDDLPVGENEARRARKPRTYIFHLPWLTAVFGFGVTPAITNPTSTPFGVANSTTRIWLLYGNPRGLHIYNFIKPMRRPRWLIRVQRKLSRVRFGGLPPRRRSPA